MKKLTILTAMIMFTVVTTGIPVLAQTPSPSPNPSPTPPPSSTPAPSPTPTSPGGTPPPSSASSSTQQTVCGALRGEQLNECLNANRGTVSDLSKNVIDILSKIIGIVSILVIVIAGLMYTVSAGNPEQTKRAKNAIIYAITGVVIAAMAQVVVRFILSSV